MKQRLFIAIPFPAEVVTALTSLQQNLSGTRWVPAAQMHLTLRFLGDVDHAGIPPLQKYLAMILHPSFPLTVTGCGCFPPHGIPRVIWAGIAPSPPLLELARRVEDGVVGAGLPAEGRPFSPHITLARLPSADPGGVRHYLEEHRGFNLPPFPVSEFILYTSSLTPSGAVHTAVATFPLQDEEGA